MPIAAIPQGVEIRKISAVQKRALDELLKQQKDQTLLQTAMVALIPSITALTIAAGAGYLFIHRETIADTYQQLKDDFFSGAGKTFTDFGKTITGGAIAADTPSASVMDAAQTGGPYEGFNTCQLFEVDLVDLWAKQEEANDPFTKFAIGLNLQQKYSGMKKAGCSKPSRVDQSNWDRA